MDRQDLINLKRRYLIWLYKTTKETYDRIERKFSQLEIDKFILKELQKQDRQKRLKNFIHGLEVYIQNKEKEGRELKYQKAKPRPEFLFLELKLKAIEKAIRKELGKSALKEIKALYEKEMSERIMESMEQK